MLQTITAPVSWERMDRAIEKVKDRLLRAAAALRGAGVPYAVVGGKCGGGMGLPRGRSRGAQHPRRGPAPAPRRPLRRPRHLEAAGFHYRQVAMPGKAGTMDIFLDGPDAKVREAIHILWAGERVLADSLEPSPDVTAAEDAGDFQLISLPALVCKKLTSYRDKDRMYLRDLIDAGLVDDSHGAALPPALAARLHWLLENPE